MRPTTLLIASLLAASPVAAKEKPYSTTKIQSTLAAGGALQIAVDPKLLESCADWACRLIISSTYHDETKHAVLVVDGKGDWHIEQRTGDEKAEKAEADKRKSEQKAVDEAKKAKAEAEKKAKAAAPAEGEAAPAATEKPKEAWESKPILTKGERITLDRERKRQGLLWGGYLPATPEPQVAEEGVPQIDWSKAPDGLSVPEGFQRRLTEGATPKAVYVKVQEARGHIEAGAIVIESRFLPEGEFHVWTNGYWGAMLEGQPIGSSGKTGGAKVRR